MTFVLLLIVCVQLGMVLGALRRQEAVLTDLRDRSWHQGDDLADDDEGDRAVWDNPQA